MNRVRLAVAVLALSASSAAAQQSPFSYLDAAYTAKIVANELSGSVGLGFMPDGRVVRFDYYSTLSFLNSASTTNYHGDNLWSVSTLNLSQNVYGYGMGYYNGSLYINGAYGVNKVDPTTGATTVLAGSAPGTYGLKVTNAGNVISNASDGWVHSYNLATNIDTRIYNSGTFNDDLAVDGAGNIFVAALGGCQIDVLDPTGALIQQIGVAHAGYCADGITNGGGNIFANLTNGDIDKFSFSGANYTGTVTETNIASGRGCYGDFAGAGPDGAFYVNRACQTYDDNSTPGGGSGYALVRIEAVDPNNGFGDNTAPEPASIVLMATGLAGVVAVARRRKVA